MSEITERRTDTIADDLKMGLEELVRKAAMAGAGDFLREGVRVLSQALLKAAVTQHQGAERHERSPERTGQRNGYRERQWDTRVGSIDLRVPRVRDGSFYPSFPEPRNPWGRGDASVLRTDPHGKRAEQALVAVVQEAYVQGVSTRRVDDLVQALVLTGMSTSQVSRLCADLDQAVERFRTRRLAGGYPYVWLDAAFVKVREAGRVVSQAIVIAIGVRQSGEREVVGRDVGPSEDGAFWLQFLLELVARGLSGVQLVVSDARQGLSRAVAAVLSGASWQWWVSSRTRRRSSGSWGWCSPNNTTNGRRAGRISALSPWPR